MKTLYISDLDGTLLNASAELSEYTSCTLNQLIEHGLEFSVATARTAATAVHILKDIELKLPVVLMNGACVYDLQTNTYLKKEEIKETSCRRLISLLHHFHLPGFLFTIDKDVLYTFYEFADTEYAKAFIEERERKFGKYFSKVISFDECLPSGVVYFSISDKRERLLPFYEELKKDSAIRTEFYRDVYRENIWYLEICSADASKYNAVRYIKDICKFDRVVAFGDNLNDLPLFEASDECFAVGNARLEVKMNADGIIGSNYEDGVARYLKEMNEKSEVTE